MENCEQVCLIKLYVGSDLFGSINVNAPCDDKRPGHMKWVQLLNLQVVLTTILQEVTDHFYDIRSNGSNNIIKTIPCNSAYAISAFCNITARQDHVDGRRNTLTTIDFELIRALGHMINLNKLSMYFTRFWVNTTYMVRYVWNTHICYVLPSISSIQECLRGWVGWNKLQNCHRMQKLQVSNLLNTLNIIFRMGRLKLSTIMKRLTIIHALKRLQLEKWLRTITTLWWLEVGPPKITAIRMRNKL